MATRVTTASLAFLLTLNLLSLSFVDCYAVPFKRTPSSSPSPSIEKGKKCPRDILKFGICAQLLHGRLADATFGKRRGTQCCSLMEGLVNLEAALCICTAIKADILGKKINIPISLNLILSACRKTIPKGYQC